MLNNEVIQIYGDGSQSRTNTYVEDLVSGLCLSMKGAINGEIYNLSGSEQYSISRVVGLLEGLMGKKARIEFVEERLGDQKETNTSSIKAKEHFGYFPKTKIEVGLQKQIDWQRDQLNF